MIDVFNPTQLVMDAFVDRLEVAYRKVYSNLEPSYPGIISFIGRMVLENIANGDAPYHDFNHTILVTQVGQEILRGKHIAEGGVTPRDWLNFTVSLLCHDVGYVRGICRGDREDRCVIAASGDTVALPPGATGAFLAPYHVDRSKLFVDERLGRRNVISEGIDSAAIKANIEFTRFPVPEADDYAETGDYPGLLRGADLIGQLADPNYLRKVSALFFEFQETGLNERLGYKSPADLRAAYPNFYWKVISPYIGTSLRHLQVTQEGKQWIANLYAHVFAEEHGVPALGSARLTVVKGMDDAGD